jgi:hypothetical protein
MSILTSIRRLAAAVAIPLALLSSEPILAQTEITVANAAGDDTAAFRQALQDAENLGGNVTIKFLKGQYDFDLVANPPPGSYTGPFPGAFQLEGVHDITIRGTGSDFLNGVAYPGTKLMFHGFDPNAAPGSAGAYPRSFFKFLDVDGLTMTNLKILMAREPHSSGKVVAKNASTLPYWFELEMDADYPDLASGFQIERIDDFDHTSKRLMSKDFSVQLNYSATNPLYSATVLGPRQVRVTSNETNPNSWFNSRIAAVPVSPTQPRGLVLIHSKHLAHFIVASRCSDLTLDHLLINDMSGSALVAWSCDNITIDDVDIQPRSGRLMSLTGDAFHLQDTTGAVDVRDCEIRAIGDDGLNVFTKVLQVTGLTGTTATLHQPPSAYFEVEWTPGEAVQFLQPDLDKLTPTTTLTSFALNTPAPPIFTDRTYTATFSSTPVCQVGDFATNLSRRPASVTVTNCTVEDNIARGLAIHVPRATITDCTFRRNTGPAIMVETDLMFFYEVGPGNETSDQITIEGCTIDDSNRYTWMYLGAVSIIGLHGSTANPIVAAPGLYHNVTLRENVLKNLGDDVASPRARRAAVWMGSTDVSLFEDNLFHNIESDVSIVRLENSTNSSTDGQNCISLYSGTPAFEFLGTYSFNPPPITPSPGCW